MALSFPQKAVGGKWIADDAALLLRPGAAAGRPAGRLFPDETVNGIEMRLWARASS
jgi:hypothetical protein